MYNTHRGMLAHQAPPSNRLTELLDQVRAEFENQSGGVREYENSREALISQQMNEMEVVRNKVYGLEQAHAAMKQSYEKKIQDLERELAMRPGHGPSSVGANQHGEPAQPQPPSIGHGPRDLFGQIMSGQGGNNNALAPPPQDQTQPQGLPAHLTQGAGLNTGTQPPQHQPFSGYPQGPAVNGYGPQPPQAASSPGPGKPRTARGPPGAATPQQSHPGPNPPSPRSYVPTPPPGQHHGQLAPQHHVPNVGNALGQLNIEELPPSCKKFGEEWWAIFNPQIRRQLDVDLVHTLDHQSVVCCVRFSHDGRYIATGCNRAAQIFDVNSGNLIAHLEDEGVDKDGDLYIRSVCFSPDGKFLATGAEDKIIRVWDIANKEIKVSFRGHEQDIYSLDFARNGRVIASGSGDRTVRLWDVETQREIMTLRIEDGVTTVALSADGRLVAAGSLDRSVRVWETEEGRMVERLEGASGHKDSVYSVAFHPSGRELVSGSLDRTIKMWELNPLPPQGGRGISNGSSSKLIPPPRCIRNFDGHADFVLSVALTPDGNWVLSGSKDRGVQFWDPNTGVAHLHLQGHKNSVISVAPSPTGRMFATGSGDSKAKIWRYTELEPRRP